MNGIRKLLVLLSVLILSSVAMELPALATPTVNQGDIVTYYRDTVGAWIPCLVIASSGTTVDCYFIGYGIKRPSTTQYGLIQGVKNGLTYAASPTVGSWTLVDASNGLATVPTGGTGVVTLPAASTLLGNGVAPVATVGPCANGQLLYGVTSSFPVCGSPYFVSAQQTANGSAQNIAHGLAAVPSAVSVWAEDTTAVGIISGGYTITQGSHDATNIKITATTGLKYRVIGFR